jgi:hypothetical protein
VYHLVLPFVLLKERTLIQGTIVLEGNIKLLSILYETWL